MTNEFSTIEEARTYVMQNFRRMVAHGAALRGYPSVPSFHWFMADFLEGTRPHWVKRAKIILGGRFLAKTWLGARQYVKWRLIRCPWTQIIVHSSNDKMAGRFVGAMKSEMREDPLTAEWIPATHTSDYEFTLNGITHEQGSSIVAAGIKTSMTGARADVYIFDDPEPDTEPEAFHDRILEAFGEAGDILHSPARHLSRMVDLDGNPLSEVPIPERTQLIVLGQPHCATSAYIPRPEDFEEDAEGHPLIDAACIRIPTTIRGKPLDSIGAWRWPAMAEQKYRNLQEGRASFPSEVKRTMPTSRWELQHQINTDFMVTAGPVLRTKEIEELVCRPVRNILIIDPADSEEGCEWGVAVLGMHKKKIHISFLGGEQGETYEGDDWEAMSHSVWRRIFDLGAELGCREVFIEKNLKACITACRRYTAKAKKRGLMRGIVVTEFHAVANKKRRIPETLEPMVNNQMVSAHPAVMADRINRRQMVKLRWDKLPKPNDRIDVLAHGFSILYEEPALYNAGDGACFPQMGDPDPGTGFARVAVIGTNGFHRVRK